MIYGPESLDLGSMISCFGICGLKTFRSAKKRKEQKNGDRVICLCFSTTVFFLLLSLVCFLNPGSGHSYLGWGCIPKTVFKLVPPQLNHILDDLDEYLRSGLYCHLIHEFYSSFHELGIERVPQELCETESTSFQLSENLHFGVFLLAFAWSVYHGPYLPDGSFVDFLLVIWSSMDPVGLKLVQELKWIQSSDVHLIWIWPCCGLGHEFVLSDVVPSLDSLLLNVIFNQLKGFHLVSNVWKQEREVCQIRGDIFGDLFFFSSFFSVLPRLHSYLYDRLEGGPQSSLFLFFASVFLSFGVKHHKSGLRPPQSVCACNGSS